MLSQMLIFLCMPHFGNKHPCLERLNSDDSEEECRLFGRPRMYVPKIKYIPIDDFTFEVVTVYQDVMKTGKLDLPWEALAAHVAPWDPYEINTMQLYLVEKRDFYTAYYVRRIFNQPYPFELEPRKELQMYPVDNLLLKRMFMTDYKWKNSLLDELEGYNKNVQKRDTFGVYYPQSSWPIIAAFIFKVFSYFFFHRYSTFVKDQFKNHLDDNFIGSRRMLKAKRRLIKC